MVCYDTLFKTKYSDHKFKCDNNALHDFVLICFEYYRMELGIIIANFVLIKEIMRHKATERLMNFEKKGVWLIITIH